MIYYFTGFSYSNEVELQNASTQLYIVGAPTISSTQAYELGRSSLSIADGDSYGYFVAPIELADNNQLAFPIKLISGECSVDYYYNGVISCTVYFNATTGTISVYRGDSSETLLVVSSPGILDTEWHWVVIEATVKDATDGRITVKLDEVLVADTLPNNLVSTLSDGPGNDLIAVTARTGCIAYLGLFAYASSGTLTAPCSTIIRYPSGDVFTESTPSIGTSPSACVDESTISVLDFTTFLDGQTDIYSWSALSSDFTIPLASRLVAYSSIVTTSYLVLEDSLTTNTFMQSAQEPFDYYAYQRFDSTDPSGAPWTLSSLESVNGGYQILDADDLSPGGDLAWLSMEVLVTDLNPSLLQGEYQELPISLFVYESNSVVSVVGTSSLDGNGFLWDRRRLENSSDIATRYESTLGGFSYGIKDGIPFDSFVSGVVSGCSYDSLVNKFVNNYVTWTPKVKTGIYTTSHHNRLLFSDHSFVSKFSIDQNDRDAMFHVLHDDCLYSSISINLYKRSKNLILPFWSFEEVDGFTGELISETRNLDSWGEWSSDGNQRQKEFRIIGDRVYLNGFHFIDKTLGETPPGYYPELVVEHSGEGTGQGRNIYSKYLPVESGTVRLWLNSQNSITEIPLVSDLSYQIESIKCFSFDYDLGIATLSGYKAPDVYLNSDISDSDVVIPATSESYYLNDYPQKGVILIGTEKILYTERTDTEFLNCIRGYDGSIAQSFVSGEVISHIKQGLDIYGQLYLEYKAVPRIEYEITSSDLRTANRNSWLDVSPSKNVETNNMLQIYPGEQDINSVSLETTTPSIGGNLYGPIYFGSDTSHLIATVLDSSGLAVDDASTTIRILSGNGYLNGEVGSYQSLTNSKGQAFADYTIPYENRFIEFIPRSVQYDGPDTVMTMNSLDKRLIPSDFWVFQILKHDQSIGSQGTNFNFSSSGTAVAPYGAYYYIVDGLLDDAYLGGFVYITDGTSIFWKEIVFLEEVLDTIIKTKLYLDSVPSISPSSLVIYKKEEVVWDSALLNGSRKILYSYSPTAQHPLSGAIGAYFPVRPDEISGNNLIFKNIHLPIAELNNRDNNLASYSVVCGQEVSIRAEARDPITGWLKVSNILRFSIRIPNFLIGVQNSDGIYIPNGFKLLTEEFNQGSAIGLPNFITINPVATGINQLSLQLSI